MTSSTVAPTTRTLATPEVDLVFDVRGPLPTADGRPPLLMIGQPMDAGGFVALAGYFDDRTVVTYDPRGGVGRTTRKDGRTEVTPQDQAADLHALVGEIGGPVDLFASSGGAVTALALVAGYPDDVRVLVAHEPPLLTVLPDAEAALAGERAYQQAYQDRGWGAGMAAFIAYTSWPGEFTDEFLARPAPEPAQFGLPTDDDGTRTDPLLSGVAGAITAYRPDVDALTAAPTRVVIAAGVESRNLMTWRASEALAAMLGVDLTEFPSHHGGFLGEGGGYAGQPEAFADRLREVLDAG
jgi:pimeloyl-ACP methyl ester carboxylesterase